MVVRAVRNMLGVLITSCWSHPNIDPTIALLSCEGSLLGGKNGIECFTAATNVVTGDTLPCIVPVEGLVNGR